MKTIFQSGVAVALSTELVLVASVAFAVCLMNALAYGYQDLSGTVQAAPLGLLAGFGPFSLPALPFTIGMPVLSLLLVFRTNTAYSRWNEARTLWGGVVNHCRNVARQANTFCPETEHGAQLRDRMAGNTVAYSKALRNFLRGPSDDPVLRSELEQLASAGLLSDQQVQRTMDARNRPMFCLSAMSHTLRRADLDPIDRSRIDTSITALVDITGACERIFKSPIPLVYTRHTARFITVYCTLLPLGLYEAMGKYWNHWATVPASAVIAFFLFGIEEIGIQIECAARRRERIRPARQDPPQSRRGSRKRAHAKPMRARTRVLKRPGPAVGVQTAHASVRVSHDLTARSQLVLATHARLLGREPFSILPLEALCDSAIEATMDEMIDASQQGVFDLSLGATAEATQLPAPQQIAARGTLAAEQQQRAAATAEDAGDVEDAGEAPVVGKVIGTQVAEKAWRS